MESARRPVAVGLAVAAAIVGGGLLAAHQLTGGASGPTMTPSAQILVLLNQRRTQAHLVPLKRDRILASLARIHNKDQRRDGFFGHDNPTGQTFFERLAYLHRHIVGEVIAYGSGAFSTPAGLVDLWMHSAGHKRVILTPGMRRIGVSVICGPFLNQPGICLATADLSS